MNTPKVTDADREAAEKFATPYSSDTQNAYDWVKNAYLSGKLDERAKVDELVRALEADFKEVEESNDPEMLEYYFKRTAEVLKQFSGRSG